MTIYNNPRPTATSSSIEIPLTGADSEMFTVRQAALLSVGIALSLVTLGKAILRRSSERDPLSSFEDESQTNINANPQTQLNASGRISRGEKRQLTIILKDQRKSMRNKLSQRKVITLFSRALPPNRQRAPQGAQNTRRQVTKISFLM